MYVCIYVLTLSRNTILYCLLILIMYIQYVRSLEGHIHIIQNSIYIIYVILGGDENASSNVKRNEEDPHHEHHVAHVQTQLHKACHIHTYILICHKSTLELKLLY